MVLGTRAAKHATRCEAPGAETGPAGDTHRAAGHVAGWTS